MVPIQEKEDISSRHTVEKLNEQRSVQSHIMSPCGLRADKMST